MIHRWGDCCVVLRSPAESARGGKTPRLRSAYEHRVTADRTQCHARRRRAVARIDHAAPDDADRSSPSARRLMRTVSGRARTDAELRPYAPPHGRVPWITAGGIVIQSVPGKAEVGSRTGRTSRPTTTAGCLPGRRRGRRSTDAAYSRHNARPDGSGASSPEGVACRLSSVRRGRFRGSLHHLLPRSTGRHDPPDARIPAAPQRLHSHRRAPAGSGPTHRPHAAGSGPDAHRPGRAVRRPRDRRRTHRCPRPGRRRPAARPPAGRRRRTAGRSPTPARAGRARPAAGRVVHRTAHPAACGTGPPARAGRAAGRRPVVAGPQRPGRRHERVQRAVRPLLRRRLPVRALPDERPDSGRGHHPGDVPARPAPHRVRHLPGPRHRGVVRHDRPQPDPRPRQVEPVPPGVDDDRTSSSCPRAPTGPSSRSWTSRRTRSCCGVSASSTRTSRSASP